MASYADVVESVDRAKVARGLQRGAHERGRDLDVLLQVSLDPPGASGRAGVDPDQLDALADEVAGLGALRLRGLMAVAPLGEDPAAAFARLAEIRRGLPRRPTPTPPRCPPACPATSRRRSQAGATHVRVGSAILGPRPRDK